jgi:hypothetical protein
MTSFDAPEAWPLHDLAFCDCPTPKYVLDTAQISIDNSSLIDTMILKADAALVVRCVHHIGAVASTTLSRAYIDASTGLLLSGTEKLILCVNT